MSNKKERSNYIPTGPWQRLTSERVYETPWISVYHETVITPDRKSTRLNSSHVAISYAVFCLHTTRHPSSITPLRPYTTLFRADRIRATPDSALNDWQAIRGSHE